MTKQKYTYIVVEDVDMQRQNLIKMLSERLDLVLDAEFDNAEDAFAYLTAGEASPPDLMFLDIEMPEVNGFSLLESLRRFELPTRVVVATAFPAYAPHGYEYNITAYLMKPLAPELLHRAVDKAIAERRSQPDPKPLAEDAKDHLVIKESGRLVKIKHADILYCEGANVNIKIVTPHHTHTIRERMKNLEKSLPDSLFLRVHDSFIIHLQYVKSYAGNCTFVEVENPTSKALYSLAIGPTYRERSREVLERLF